VPAHEAELVQRDFRDRQSLPRPHGGGALARWWCGSINEAVAVSTRPGLYQCRACRKQFTVTVGTALEGSNLPLRHWYLAMYLMLSTAKPISAMSLSKQLGVQYRTCWHLLRRLRAMLAAGEALPLAGVVEADETHGVGKARNRAQIPAWAIHSAADNDRSDKHTLSPHRQPFWTPARLAVLERGLAAGDSYRMLAAALGTSIGTVFAMVKSRRCSASRTSMTREKKAARDAEICRLIRRWILAGAPSAVAIAAELTRREIPTMRGAAWSAQRVVKLLKRVDPTAYILLTSAVLTIKQQIGTTNLQTILQKSCEFKRELRLCFERLVLEGADNTVRLAAELNRRGILTIRGKIWTVNSLGMFLKKNYPEIYTRIRCRAGDFRLAQIKRVIDGLARKQITGLTAIARELNAKHVRTRSGKGPWRPHMVYHVLRLLGRYQRIQAPRGATVLTVAQFAHKAELPRLVVSTAVKRGELPRERQGRRIMIPSDALALIKG
jgi:transposase-like protein